MRSISEFFTFMLSFLLSCLLSGMVWAQDPVPNPVPNPVPDALPEPKPLMTIRGLRSTLEVLSKDRDEKQGKGKAAGTAEEKEKYAFEIKEINEKISSLNLDLESVATGVDVRIYDRKLDQTVNFTAEFQELVQPIVQELKRVTAKPRELEELRGAVAFHSKRRNMADKAVGNLRELVAKSNDDTIKAILVGMEKDWVAEKEASTNEMNTAQYQLDDRLQSEDALWATMKEGAASFFRTRGRSILCAIAIMALVFFLMRFIHGMIQRMEMFQAKGKTFAVRVVDVIYYGATLVLTVLAGMFAFYALGDWMLLGFSMLLVAGVVWAGKTALPGMYEQIKLMLNLGSVREGERIIYEGVPWQVRRISIYSDLINSSLEGGHVRLPLRDLIPLSSRQIGSDEPLFPCRKGDWIKLADSTVGKVIRQTPDWVQIVLLGSSVKTYTVSDFLAQTPRNLSRGFRFSGRFGIDYAHQRISTTEVPDLLAKKLKKGLSELVGEDNMIDVRVDFASAGASSLDYAILADFNGDAAEKYFQIDRMIQRICVDACNEFGWVIPFTQITVHQAEGEKA